MQYDAHENQEPTLLDYYQELFNVNSSSSDKAASPDLINHITLTVRDAIARNKEYMGDDYIEEIFPDYLDVLKQNPDNIFLHLSIAALLLHSNIEIKIETIKQLEAFWREATPILEKISTSIETTLPDLDEFVKLKDEATLCCS